MQISQVHNIDEDIILSAHQTTIYVPKDAMDLTGNFIILLHQPNLFSFAIKSEWSRPIVVNIEYWNEDGVRYSGITFSEPIRICFALTSEQWKDFTQRPDDFQVQYFDSKKFPSRWIIMPMAMDPDRYELCTQTDHLSLYALAIRSSESIPVTGTTLTLEATSKPTTFDPSDHRRGPEADGQPVATVKPPTKPPTTEPPPTETEEPPTKAKLFEVMVTESTNVEPFYRSNVTYIS